MKKEVGIFSLLESSTYIDNSICIKLSDNLIFTKASIFKTEAPEDFGTGKFVKYQICLWDLIEKPETSKAAQVISNISILFVVISTVGMVLATMPDLEEQYPKLALIEAVCISWFTIEYLLRYLATCGS